MKDFIGQEIKLNDTVVYPTKRCSSLYMNIATVIKVTEKNITVSRKCRYSENYIKVCITRTDRVVVLPKRELPMQPADYDRVYGLIMTTW